MSTELDTLIRQIFPQPEDPTRLYGQRGNYDRMERSAREVIDPIIRTRNALVTLLRARFSEEAWAGLPDTIRACVDAEMDAARTENARLRALLKEAIDAFEHIDCGNAQCNDRWGGCDRRCALHARAAQKHFEGALAAAPHPAAQPEAEDAALLDALIRNEGHDIMFRRPMNGHGWRLYIGLPCVGEGETPRAAIRAAMRETRP